MLLLIDIGNTNTHLGLASDERVIRQADMPTAAWFSGAAERPLCRFVGRAHLQGAATCSVVPRSTPLVCQSILRFWHLRCLELTVKTLAGLGIDYPKPRTIGPDRLA